MSDRERDLGNGDEWLELRDAWSGAEPSTGHGESLESEDAQTRATVLLLREAWSALPIPEPVLPIRHAARRLQPRRLQPKHWLSLLAAALMLLALGLHLRSLATPVEAPTETLLAARYDPAEQALDLRVEVTSDQRIVLRSGTVRLYLPPASASPQSPTSFQPASSVPEGTQR